MKYCIYYMSTSNPTLGLFYIVIVFLCLIILALLSKYILANNNSIHFMHLICFGFDDHLLKVILKYCVYSVMIIYSFTVLNDVWVSPNTKKKKKTVAKLKQKIFYSKNYLNIYLSHKSNWFCMNVHQLIILCVKTKEPL